MDNETFNSLQDAAEYVGVTPSTIHRWITIGLLSEESAKLIREGKIKRWIIQKDALDTVKFLALQQGPGAFKAEWIRFTDVPTGFVCVAIADVQIPVLVSLLHKYAHTYNQLSHLKDIPNLNEQISKVHEKCKDIMEFLELKGVSYKVPKPFDVPNRI